MVTGNAFFQGEKFVYQRPFSRQGVRLLLISNALSNAQQFCMMQYFCRGSFHCLIGTG